MQRLFTFPAAMLGTVAALSGCADTPPSRFYTLAPIASPGGASGGEQIVTTRTLAIGVGPVTLASYLDRPQIVRRSGSYLLDLAEFDKWAEPLDQTMARTVAENLSVLLATDTVFTLPRARFPRVDYVVEIDVERFDLEEGGDVVLLSRWVLLGPGERTLIDNRRRYRATPSAIGFEGQAAAMSETIAQLSRDIATEIRAAPR